MGDLISISERLNKGRKAERDSHKQGEKLKVGTLRAGTSGIMSETGDVAAQCHRKAHLRQLGVELEEPTKANLIMWELGTLNEVSVYQNLLRTLASDEVILREEEIPTTWFTENQTKVTGRPDMVICKVEKKDGDTELRTPVRVLELKSVSSFSTGLSVLFERTPKLAHLAQLGHYMWKLGTGRGSLIYKQYAKQAVADWVVRLGKLPKQGEPLSEFLEYNKAKKPGSVLPFEIVYDVVIDNQGTICYKLETEAGDRYTKTVVSIGDINRFYEFVSTMQSEKKLGPRPKTVKANGKEEIGWNMCQARYCALSETCDKHESNYDNWVSNVLKLVEKKND